MGEGHGRARIDWCDIYKGISICVVVLAHTTYEFDRNLNQYIYQYVIAGLFFISGYTAKARSRSVLEDIFRKFYKLMVPYYTLHVAGFWLFWVLQQAGILSAVSTTQYTVGYGEALVSMLDGSNIISCDWLGAMWFVPVLFLAEVFFIILTRIFRKDSVVFLASVLLFLFGEWMAASGVHTYSLDLAGIAQGFYVCGYMFQKKKEREQRGWLLLLEAMLIGFVWWGSIRLGFRYTFDWPVRDVNGPVDYIMPFLGIMLTIVVSRFLIKCRGIKELFIYLGQNSMGIMCFHFIGFKLAYLVLILLGQMDAGEAYRLIPGPMMEKGWIFIYVAGIGTAVAVWKGLNRFPTVSLLLGGGNAGRIYHRISEYRAAESLREVFDFSSGLIRETAVRYKVFLAGLKHLKLAAVLAVLCIAGGVGIKFYRYCGPREVTFPCGDGGIYFEEGWLPQSDTEDYRWFAERAGVKIFLVNQDELILKGYIPDTVEDATYLSIRVNGEEAYREAVTEGFLIDLQLDIEEYVRPFRRNTLEIETDGIRIAKENDPDQRNLSALINSISIY